VDEVHCVPEWGNSFRPDFQRLGEIRSIVKSGVKVMALTATITTDMIKIIRNKLAFKGNVISRHPDRENLSIQVQYSNNLLAQVDKLGNDLAVLGKNFPRTIIFGKNFEEIINIRDMFKKIVPQEQDYKTRLWAMYNSETPTYVKQWIIDNLKTDIGPRLLIATSAFGLGIDSPDIRRVYFFGLPHDPVSFWQQAGRGGRDGKVAIVYCYYNGHCTRGKYSKFWKKFVKTDRCRKSVVFEVFGTKKYLIMLGVAIIVTKMFQVVRVIKQPLLKLLQVNLRQAQELTL